MRPRLPGVVALLLPLVLAAPVAAQSIVGQVYEDRDADGNPIQVPDYMMEAERAELRVL